MSRSRYPIIDSHVHLYADSHLTSLHWAPSLPANHILKQQQSIPEYEKATTKPEKEDNILGLILVEADRISSPDPDGWQGPLDEVKFLSDIARDQRARMQNQSSSPNARQILGIVPWAPLVSGPDALATYINRIREMFSHEETMFSLIKGFRYLLQDKPPGTMSAPPFVSALRFLGRNNFTFDLGVDARSGGLWQLREACEVLDNVYGDDNGGGGGGCSELTVVINHFCKPNFYLQLDEGSSGGGSSNDDFFEQWATNIRKLAGFPHTYMKLSGFFSELPPQDADAPASLKELSVRIRPWVDVVLDTFTPGRIMFGSDWPVCTANGLGSTAWQRWHDLVSYVMDDRRLTPDEKQLIWSGTAIKAYSIKL